MESSIEDEEDEAKWTSNRSFHFSETTFFSLMIGGLKSLSFVGGFPLRISRPKKCTEDGIALKELRLKFSSSFAACTVAMVMLLVPGVTVLTILMTLSIRWSDFQKVLSAGNFTFWDSLSLVLANFFALIAKWPEVIYLSRSGPCINVLYGKMGRLWHSINPTGSEAKFACQANWRYSLMCFCFNMLVSIVSGYFVYFLSKAFGNTFLECSLPVIYGIYCMYIWYSPVCLSVNLLFTHYFNAMTTLVAKWSESIEKRDIDTQVDLGFDIIDCVAYYDHAMGHILCLEFFEAYSTLIFATFFGTSSAYQALTTTSNNFILQPKEALFFITNSLHVMTCIVKIFSLTSSAQRLTNSLKKASYCLQKWNRKCNLREIETLANLLDVHADIKPHNCFTLGYASQMSGFSVLLTFAIVLFQFKSSESINASVPILNETMCPSY